VGWAGLSPKGLGWSQPNSSFCFLVWAGPFPDIRAGPAPAWPKKKQNGGGGIIFPLPSSCMQNYIRSACRRRWSRRRKKKNGGGRRVTWRGGGGALLVWLLRWQCCGGGWWRCRGSRTAAPSSGVAVSSGREREVPALPLSSSVSFFSFSSFIVKWFLPLYSLFIFS